MTTYPIHSLPHPPQYVTSTDLSIVKKYTLETPISQMDRAVEYSKQHKEIVLKFAKGCAKTTLVYGVAGAIIGGACGIPTGPAGIAAGATKGAAAGLVVGATWGVYHEVVQVQLSRDYLNWRGTAIKEKAFPLYEQFLRDEHLTVCPLTLDLIAIPYKCKHGTTFEREELLSYFNRKQDAAVEANAEMEARGQKPTHLTDRFLCPAGRNPEISSDSDYDSWQECTYDTDYHPRLFERLRKKSLENPEIRRVVSAYQEQVRANEMKVASARINAAVEAVVLGADPSQAKSNVCTILDRLADLNKKAV